MSLSDDILKGQVERSEWLAKQSAKCGEYTPDRCPNCNRHRVMLGSDNKRRCEKCCWCIEDNNYDGEFLDYSRGL